MEVVEEVVEALEGAAGLPAVASSRLPVSLSLVSCDMFHSSDCKIVESNLFQHHLSLSSLFKLGFLCSAKT